MHTFILLPCCSATPKGLRVHHGQNWASLRLATFSSFSALSYASLPGISPSEATAARCLARSQLGYVVGDTGRSYVAGFGKNFPLQVHHRDAACTIAEDAEGFCERYGFR
jgi:endoglucanase